LESDYREVSRLPGEFAFIELELPGARDYSLPVKIEGARGRRIVLSYFGPQPELTDALRRHDFADPQPPEHRHRPDSQLDLSPAQVRQIGRELVEQTLSWTAKALQAFRERLEENLFADADRARSNQEQTELMACYRRRAGDSEVIERTFVEQLRKLPAMLGAMHSAPAKQGETEPDVDSLTLIAPDEMESWVQRTNLAATAERHNLEQLSTLTTRLNALFHSDLDNEASAWSPSVLCDTFRQGVRQLSLPLVAKKAYWRSFGETVLQELSALYGSLNVLLKDRGVLPDIARGYLIKKVEDGPIHHPPDSPPREEPTDDEPLTQPQDVPQDDISLEQPQAGEWLPPVLSKQDLQHLLRDCREHRETADRQSALDYASSRGLLSKRIGDLAERLTPEDLRSLELAEAVFHGLVTHEGLASELRNQVLDLEPLVTSAILDDESFVVNRHHPARRFLSELAEIGIAGPPGDRELLDLLPSIGAELDALRDEPSRAFTSALSRIEPLLQRRREQELRNLESTVELCEAEQLLAQAKHQIGEVLLSRVGSVQLPRFLVDLIMVGWRHLLTLIRLQKGSGSAEWQQALELTDQLVLRFGPDAPAEPSWVTVIDRAESLMTQHRCLHLLESPAFRKTKEVAYQLERGQNLGLPAEDLEQIPLEQTALARELLETDSEQLEQDQETGSWLARAERFPVGSWFKHAPDQEEQTNLRLSWVGQEPSRFVFVNTIGVKSLDLRHREFAQRLKDRQLIPVEGKDIAMVDESIGQVLEQLYARLAYQASHDELTGLVNRKELERRLQLAVDSAKGGRAHHVLGLVTLHQLDTIRRLCGFDAANQALREISNLFSAELPEQSTLSYTGVDQFCVLHEQCSRTDALRLARDQIRLVESYRFTYDEVPYSVNGSIGLVAVDADSSDSRSLLGDAELACFAAREAGHNSIHVFCQKDRHGQHNLNENWAVRITQALDQDRLALRAQKIADLQNESAPEHYEILLAVLDERGRPSAPTEFIEAAERLRLMTRVDRWVIRQVFSWMTTHPDAVGRLRMLSINLSGQSLSDERMLEYIREQIFAHRIPGHKVCFEITETAAVENIDDAVGFVAQLQSLGCKCSLDDFGSGLSSYRYLKFLPSDYLKIDGSLIKDICSLPADLAMVQSINEIAHFMDKRVVAEYAENQDIIDKLRELGVDYAQGWGVARPVALADLPGQLGSAPSGIRQDGHSKDVVQRLQETAQTRGS